MGASTKPSKIALVVHADMHVLSAFQASLASSGFAVILARNLSTALLAVTQHVFDVAIFSSHLAEGGDIWPLAGVVHMLFPRAFVGVLTPETNILTLQSAINNGVTQLFEASTRPADVIRAVLGDQNDVKGEQSVH
jgi:ActR/RegA family two-component response regulator